MLSTLTVLLALTALFSFINERYLQLQMTIGLMLLAFIFSTAFTSLNFLGIHIYDTKFIKLIDEIDFSQVVLDGILCFLLFAGSRNVPLKKLEQRRWTVITLAILATFIATIITGSLVYWGLSTIGLTITYIQALIFGAIISPTDPIAALAILKNVGLPENLEVIIDGESQFNDGIGVVIFVTLLSILSGESSAGLGSFLFLFARQVLGGIGVGLAMAAITHIALIKSKDTVTQVLITLSAVTMGYALAESLEVSGPIASVILGLVVGNLSMPKVLPVISRDHIDVFWDMVNQLLNAVLFVLIGLIAIQMTPFNFSFISSILIAIVSVLIGRYISVYLSILLLDLEHKFSFESKSFISNLLTWAGLKGALAIALVLSMPNMNIKEIFIPMTYGVVVFSILIQGSTLKRLFPKRKLDRLATQKKS